MFQASSLTAHSLQSNDVYTLCDVSDALFVLIIALVNVQSLICVGWLRHSLFMFGFHVNDARSLSSLFS